MNMAFQDYHPSYCLRSRRVNTLLTLLTEGAHSLYTLLPSDTIDPFIYPIHDQARRLQKEIESNKTSVI